MIEKDFVWPVWYLNFKQGTNLKEKDMIRLENGQLTIVINPIGAELIGIYNNNVQLEYMWSGDSLFWAKKSPVLFPIVGTLKNDTYYFGGKAYHLGRHGFAREMQFSPSKQTDSSITFSLESNDITLQKFPFPFRFEIVYSIHENKLGVLYRIYNSGATPMYFSVGGHPAFKLPLSPLLEYKDYFLEFDEWENSMRWPISKEGLIENEPVPLLNNTKRLSLTKELFFEDAVVFKDLRSIKVRLLSDKSIHGLEFDLTGFPYLGIWAAKNADFVCIEPWCGIADSVAGNQFIMEKEGINCLEPKNVFERNWSVTVF